MLITPPDENEDEDDAPDDAPMPPAPEWVIAPRGGNTGGVELDRKGKR
jgi:hypothetical protein